LQRIDTKCIEPRTISAAGISLCHALPQVNVCAAENKKAAQDLPGAAF
jgi:hypothetical protein